MRISIQCDVTGGVDFHTGYSAYTSSAGWAPALEAFLGTLRVRLEAQAREAERNDAASREKAQKFNAGDPVMALRSIEPGGWDWLDATYIELLSDGNHLVRVGEERGVCEDFEIRAVVSEAEDKSS